MICSPMVEEERETVADLELYGLSLRSINWLEDALGVLWADELAGLLQDEAWLLEQRNCGERTVAEIRRALRNFERGRPVKTVRECVQFPPSERV